MQEEIIDVEFRNPPNFGVLTCKLPSWMLAEMKKEMFAIQENNFQNSKAIPANRNLAGHIKHEYKLPHLIDKLEPIMLDLAAQYDNRFSFFETIGTFKGERKLKLTELWVNFQKKYEFNPVHHHTGVLSFVIWIQIPYQLDQENSVFSNVELPMTSKFIFHYSSIIGQPANLPLPVDSSWEGQLALFPSMLPHSVSPFYTSDDYRISMSGNLSYV